MAKASEMLTAKVRIVPDMVGFKLSLHAELTEMSILTGWFLLEKELKIRYRREVWDMALALRRAEWLVQGCVLDTL